MFILCTFVMEELSEIENWTHLYQLMNSKAYIRKLVKEACCFSKKASVSSANHI